MAGILDGCHQLTCLQQDCLLLLPWQLHQSSEPALLDYLQVKFAQKCLGFGALPDKLVTVSKRYWLHRLALKSLYDGNHERSHARLSSCRQLNP